MVIIGSRHSVDKISEFYAKYNTRNIFIKTSYKRAKVYLTYEEYFLGENLKGRIQQISPTHKALSRSFRSLRIELPALAQ